uniref:Secreted protein n=1 Tax=Nelumbo nucifera TaxID=4432 RepID=A0A823A043_NELNU|nr:TPA_asm: hypothetical protein HUJ06_018646 [Nelumbo nucifera]
MRLLIELFAQPLMVLWLSRVQAFSICEKSIPSNPIQPHRWLKVYTSSSASQKFDLVSPARKLLTPGKPHRRRREESLTRKATTVDERLRHRHKKEPLDVRNLFVCRRRNPGN